jgi:hypothetical protein
MATQARIDANRLNAQLSTGPKTEEGKERTRHNATRHGLSGDGISLPPGMAREVEVMEDGLVAERPPRSDTERFWLHRYALEMVRLDHAERAFMTAWYEQCQRARESWDKDRLAAACELATQLPRRPELTQVRLKATMQGTAWLIGHIDMLIASVEYRGGFDEPDFQHFLDLMGYDPVRRDTIGHSEDGSREVGMLRSVREDLLAECEDHLAARDRREQVNATGGVGPDGPELRRARRYEADCYRRLREAEWQLARIRERTPTTEQPASIETPTLTIQPTEAERLVATPFPSPTPQPSAPARPRPPERRPPDREVIGVAEVEARLQALDANDPSTDRERKRLRKLLRKLRRLRESDPMEEKAA